MPNSEKERSKLVESITKNENKFEPVVEGVESVTEKGLRSSSINSIDSNKNWANHSLLSHSSSHANTGSNSSQAPKINVLNLSSDNSSGMKKDNSFPSIFKLNSDDINQSLYADLKSANPEKRNSIMSDYSGIVHNVDIDTIKYVGNKESLHLSQLNGVSKISHTSLGSDDLIDNNKNVDISSVTTPIKANIQIEEQINDDSLDPLEIPARSSRRRLAKLDNDSIIKVIKTKAENSPNKQSSNSPSPPKSLLPKLTKLPSPKKSSPLKGRHSRGDSLSSDASLKLHGRLDDIMKEVEDLKMVFQDDSLIEEKKKNTSFTAPTYSINSTTNSVNTATSFYTADSVSINNNSIADKEFNDFVDEPTENLNIAESSPNQEHSHPSIAGVSTIQPTENSTIRLKESSSSMDDRLRGQQETIKTGKSSHRHSKGSTKSKRKSTSSKNKIRPFSYETLAKLLNATDGIIIGQEFATLNIPSEEKFLIERIVDSISRLTANMMLNPARYDQSCTRLEHVLNVLEGFD
ncbi:hypothetical protein C6P40_000914 [Pichia californica]|uniref:Uncharacterized protein n=1 Tax=Pichia californica TaxID=460514 RepID=A0A9P6WLS1_9ASCO|nr:hypothetical protein C6P40_000914 [[Candida] californica]